jgi:hypothetical protein
MSTGKFSTKMALMVLLMFLLFAYACTRLENNQRASSTLIVQEAVGIPGQEGGGGTEGVPLFSDVLTCNDDHTKCAVYNDDARVTLLNQYLQVGSGIGASPSYLSDIVVNRYRVDYFRPNGRNTPGVDVPFGIDGTMNIYVVTNSTSDATIAVVRHEAKKESPLVELLTGGQEGILTANAEMKFWGQDISGRTVSGIGYLEIHFANYGP